jgi:hypothetical protein
MVSLHPTSTGTLSAAVPLTLTSVAVAGTGLSNTDLSQNLNYVWQFSGQVINQANPNITPTTKDFGNVRIGTLQQQALNVTNVAGTPPQASLDAQLSVSGAATSNNLSSINQLLAGSSDTTSFLLGLNTASACAKNGGATIALQSDSAPNGCTSNCIVNLSPQNVTVQGNVFRLATGSATSPVDIGGARVGIGALTGNLSVTNTAAADGFSENLNANITTTTPQITGSGGQITGLTPQQTNSNALNVTLDSSTAGAKSGTATVQFQSNGMGIDGGAPVNNGSQVVTVTGNVYTPAVASVLTTSPINFGIVHVNDPTQTKNVTVQNGATATALNDVLIGSISAGSGPFSGNGKSRRRSWSTSTVIGTPNRPDYRGGGYFLGRRQPRAGEPRRATRRPIAHYLSDIARRAGQPLRRALIPAAGRAGQPDRRRQRLHSRLWQHHPGRPGAGGAARLPQQQSARRPGVY